MTAQTTSPDRARLASLFALANAALAAGRVQEALSLAQQAHKLAPDEADCANLLGVCAIALGDGAAAEQCWRKAIVKNPQTLEARRNLARYYRDSDRPADAEACLHGLIALAPHDVGAQLLLGHLLAARQDPQASLHYRTALAQNGNLAEAWANLALLLEKDENWNEAEAHHRRALALAPESAEIHVNLGNLLARLQRYDEAEQAYGQALALKPDSAVAHSNLGVLQADLGRDTEAEQSLRRALQLNPAYQLGRYNLAMLLLTQGRMEEGWPLLEARHHPDLPNPDAPRPNLPASQWQGEPLAGKRLLVWPEQGYGDMIQFCRYLPQLKRQGAARIDIVCRKAQVALLETLAGVDRVIALDDADVIVGQHDYWTLPMSLPLRCGTTLADITAPLPYLHASAERRERWRQRIAPARGRKIGLAWRGNAKHANDSQRSLPGFSVLRPLLSVENTAFFSLQMERREPLPPGVVDLGADIADFADSAAIIEQLDLLITVDTAIAHVAGALGKPCWIMLPSHRADWRWLRDRSDSPWYPGVVKLYRQGKEDSWQDVAERIAHDLRRFAQ